MSKSRNHYYLIFFIISVLLSSYVLIAQKPVNEPVAWKFIVTEQEIYKVTYNNLVQYGILPKQFDLARISIQHKETEI